MSSSSRERNGGQHGGGSNSGAAPKAERSVWMRGYRLIFGADLPANLKHTLHVVFFRCGVRSKCFASIGSLARLAGVDTSTVRRHLHKLVENGLLNAQPMDGGTTHYTIRWDQLSAVQRLDADDQRQPSTSLNANPFTNCDPTPFKSHGHNSQVATQPPANCQPNKLPNKTHNKTIQQADNGVLKWSKGRRDEQSEAQMQTCGGWPEPITIQRLRDRTQVIRMFDFALDRGWVNQNDHDRFQTLANYCVRKSEEGAIKDVGAAFTVNVKAHRWFGSDGDEQSAIRPIPRTSASSDGDLSATVLEPANEIKRLLEYASSVKSRERGPPPHDRQEESDLHGRRLPTLEIPTDAPPA